MEGVQDSTGVLRLADGFTLPLDATTETFAILAKRGIGKTNTAVVLTEELVGAGQQVIVVDPVGVWYGLRSSKDGSGDGLPVVIVGGDHADLPLAEGSGSALARLLLAHRQSAVLDLSHLSKSVARRLMTDFLEELYRRCRHPMHLVVDEAALAAARGDNAFGAVPGLVFEDLPESLGPGGVLDLGMVEPVTAAAQGEEALQGEVAESEQAMRQAQEAMDALRDRQVQSPHADLHDAVRTAERTLEKATERCYTARGRAGLPVMAEMAS